MPLPRFQQLRPGGLLGRLEDNVAEFARSLTDERAGVLSHGLTLSEHARGKVYRLRGVKKPDDWVPVTLSNGFARSGALQYAAPAVRCDDAGEVWVRGLLTRAGAPAAQTEILKAPAGYESTDGNRRYVVAAGSGAGAVDLIQGGSLQYLSGDVSLFDVSGAHWRAVNGPPAWPAASQVVVLLGEEFPGAPEVVRVEDALVGSMHFGPLPCWWGLERVGRVPALRLYRIGGLPPLSTSDIILSVLVA